MSDVKPLVIDRDVRHMGPDDGMSSVAVTNVTKQLADRDALISESLNEVIAKLLNDEILVTVPVPGLVLAGLATSVIANFRIPAGYQARVFNAAVASTPSQKALLEIVHSPGTFGQDGSGVGATSVVSTVTEFTSGTDSGSTGEYVIKLTNQSSSSISAVASVLIALKPV